MPVGAGEKFDRYYGFKRWGQAAFLEGLSFGPKGTINVLFGVKDIGLPAARAAGVGGCGQDWAPGKLDLTGAVAGYKSLWKPFTHLFDFQV